LLSSKKGGNAMQQQKWSGFERRRLGTPPYRGENRRRRAGYQATAGTPGVNAEEPKTEQDHHDLARQRGPNPRIPK
jgi:hypothetical protein